MAAFVAFIVRRGEIKGKPGFFAQPARYLVGRGLDCDARIPDEADYQTVSRHHCRFDINPPQIHIRDLGSLNGTYVNGVSIGQRSPSQTPEQSSDELSSPASELHDGDEIRFGGVEVTVRILEELKCGTCGDEIPESEIEKAGISEDEILCPSCRRRVDKTITLNGQASARTSASAFTIKKGFCPQCGQRLSLEERGRGDDEFLCRSCAKEPENVVKTLMAFAAGGNKKLAALQDYRIVKSLGQGSAGAAFLIKNEKTEQLLALKILLPEVALNERARMLFLREVENSRLLDHKNVVKVFDSGSYHNIFFYTMEYCDGASVFDLKTGHGGVLTLDMAADIVLQTLDGLEYIHNVEVPSVKLADGGIGQGKGLVHRDLKPGNIFLAGSGEDRIAKIADVGVGKAFDTAGLSGHTVTGNVAGTPVFMPRQQIINFKYAKPDVDVWALAATFYNLLTGFYPRDFPKGEDLWLVVLKTKPVPIRQRKSSIPENLAKVIDKALIDDPEITFQSAAELKQALVEAL
ncbi:MAG: FHA domain-containing protein [Deltaproteobacteria bacterium]|nr:FHA domain-containing protein [Deltaproteobacteria bacterium]